MEYQKKYQKWLTFPGMNTELSRELSEILQNEEEIASRFSRDMAFGTGGIRGRMGAGTARFNVYIVRKTTAGLAQYLLEIHPQKTKPVSVVIAYDTRYNSHRFALETAAVLTHYGIKAWLFSEPVPTPLLSFAVRELKAAAGVVITASHNPFTDNGYKVYGRDGGQITDGFAQAVTAHILRVKDELAVPVGSLEEAGTKGLYELVGKEVEERYFERLKELYLGSSWWRKDGFPVVVVYTPLHGTGARIIPQALRNSGIQDLFLVEEQMQLNSSGSTVRHPNPEDWEVFKLAKDLGEKKKADLLLATDLDGDRLGVAVRDSTGLYVPLTGNQLGCLMLDYILSQKKELGILSQNGIMVQTVVTSAMGKAIAAAYEVEVIETLTGFKYIGEQIKERVDSGRSVFLFGFEESYGYLVGDFVRDKDGVQASQLAAEMAAYYKTHKGMTLLDALEQLWQRFGYYQEELVNLELAEKELDGVERIMNHLRFAGLSELKGVKILRIADYLQQTIHDLLLDERFPTGLPASNSLKYFLDGDAWFCIRPSGTEPKLKIYLGVREGSMGQAVAALSALKDQVLALVKKA